MGGGGNNCCGGTCPCHSHWSSGTAAGAIKKEEFCPGPLRPRPSSASDASDLSCSTATASHTG